MMFALFMIVILLITGFIWLLDIAVLSKKRQPGADEPIWVGYAKSFFSGDSCGIFCTFIYCGAVQDSLWLYDAYAACRRFYSGE